MPRLAALCLVPFALACGPGSVTGGEILGIPFSVESAMVYPVHLDDDFEAPERALSVNLSPNPDLCANTAAGVGTEATSILQLNVQDSKPLAPGTYRDREVSAVFLHREACDDDDQVVGVSVQGEINLSAFAAGGDAAGDFDFTLVTFDFSNEAQSDDVRGSFAGELCEFDPDDVGFEDPCR
jgi:hypothetical protein